MGPKSRHRPVVGGVLNAWEPGGNGPSEAEVIEQPGWRPC